MTSAVSDSAKRGLEQLFIRSVSSHLAVSSDDQVVVEPLAAHREAPVVEDEFYVLTIANFFFRVLVIFHFQENESTQSYFSRQEGKLGFADVFPEVCNMCCGALSRELGVYFPHLGMSTPERLGQACLPFLDLLRPAHTARFSLTINQHIALHATLAVVTYRPLDFRLHPQALQAPVLETGVLELF